MLPINEVTQGDCLDLMALIADATVDSCVTDPPYGLSFMGKKWDYDVPSVEIWREVFRVLKPGAHLLAFSGSRTYHRMVVNIEDAGFEIRDQIMWIYAQGFPKGQDIAWELHKKACKYYGHMVEYDYEETTEQTPEYRMRFMRATYLQTPVYACAKCGQVLQPRLSKQDPQEYRKAWTESKISWGKQPGMEGRGDLEAPKRELQRCKICKMSHGFLADGAEGWLHNGAQISNGKPSWAVTNEDGNCSSYRPQSIEQFDKEFNAFFVECRAQEIRGFNVALKPAHEPIVVARKPLSEKMVAANVLKWGTGGINIDGCRIGSEIITTYKPKTDRSDKVFGKFSGGLNDIHKGRWPANVILGDDETAAMLDEQSGARKSGGHITDHERDKSNINFADHHNEWGGYQDSGGASRFFYCPKAIKAERNAGIGGGNNHPTVKPIELMRYLVRLVTPPGGIILDPFAGSASTLIAAYHEAFNFIGIELSEEYCEIARQRIERETRQERLKL